MERSFRKQVASLRLGQGETFHGEGILAVTKALLQSGVAYVGGYQGAPISHLLDVLVDAQALLAELGVHLETNSNEASAAAMLAASINYPVRGAVTWKSIVGTNVASDALSNLASAGVRGGALIVVGEDYGEGASVVQERTHAFALKSSLWLADPRPDLATIVNVVERSFELSEASSTPVILELRIRACHVQGRFTARDNRPPALSARNPLAEPAPFDYARLSHPPSTYLQEKRKVAERLPAARRFIVEHGLNEEHPGDLDEVGIIVQGGLYNSLARALLQLGLADVFGHTRVPLLVLNVTHPLVPEQVAGFCAGKKAVLVVEEGHPEFIEQQVNVFLRQGDLPTRIHGKDVLPAAGEYTLAVLERGLADFLARSAPAGVEPAALSARVQRTEQALAAGAEAVGAPLPARPPSFCTGCPERPVFSAIKLLEREQGRVHVNTDIGCHSFATFEPFSLGNSILGYGMSLASGAGVGPIQQKRTLSIMGDGGFWHNGLQSGVVSARFNGGDGVLLVMQNGYASATGQQDIPSSASTRPGAAAGVSIARTLRALGVRWLRTVHSYRVERMLSALREAFATPERGLKVIIADGECMLARQRRLRAELPGRLQAGRRVVRTRFGVDEEVCTGDHSCIRLSGCPSLTVKPNPDPLRPEPVAAVNNGCVGCGLCGEVAHAAVLCPSFYRAEAIHNPSWRDRLLHGLRRRVIGVLAGAPAGEAAP